MCIVFALVWSTLQQIDGRIRLRRPFLSILDRGVPLTILFILNYLTYRDDPFLHQYRIFKWLSYLVSWTTACLTSFVISFLISASKLPQCFMAYWWFKIIATLRFCKSLIVLFAYEMFIDPVTRQTISTLNVANLTENFPFSRFTPSGAKIR